MFGDITGMMGKLKETRKKVEETKERLKSVTITEQSDDKKISVTVSANREILEIQLDEQLFYDKSKLEEVLKSTLNRALQKAGEIHDQELAAVAKDGMPNIPGLDSFLK